MTAVGQSRRRQPLQGGGACPLLLHFLTSR